MSNSITPNYTMTGSQGTLTVSGPANVTYGGVSYPPHTPVAEPDMERIIDLQTELVLVKEKLDVAVKVIADLFESKPTLELSEQAKMRHDLAEIIDDLLDRAAASERAREEEKLKIKKAMTPTTQSPLQYHIDVNTTVTTDDLRRMINEEFDIRWHRDR